MPIDRERRWPWIAAGYAVFFAIVAAATGYIYDSADPANRAMVIRLAVGFVVAVLLIHLRKHFGGDPRWEPPSAFADALTPQPLTPKLDAGFIKLRDEVANSVASQSYFEKTLWLRLCALRQAHGRPGDLTMPTERRWLGRGPSRQTIAALVEDIERQGTGR